MRFPQCFVFKHTHPAFSNPKDDWIVNIEKHFGLTWRIQTIRETKGTTFLFDLGRPRQSERWFVHADVEVKSVENKTPNSIITIVHKFHNGSGESKQDRGVFTFLQYSDKSVTLNLEVHVTINQVEGFRPILRRFNESVERFSDVKVVVKGHKFYVLKKHLASHSPVFDSMFFEESADAEKSEFELDNIDPYDFQKFLEVINGEPAVIDHTVEGILKLADFFQSETAVRSCAEFLIRSSEKPIKIKFQAAIKHKMDRLKEKCYSEMKTAADIQSVLPEDIDDFDKQDYVDLIRKAAFLNQDIDLI